MAHAPPRCLGSRVGSDESWYPAIRPHRISPDNPSPTGVRARFVCWHRDSEGKRNLLKMIIWDDSNLMYLCSYEYEPVPGRRLKPGIEELPCACFYAQLHILYINHLCILTTSCTCCSPGNFQPFAKNFRVFLINCPPLLCRKQPSLCAFCCSPQRILTTPSSSYPTEMFVSTSS